MISFPRRRFLASAAAVAAFGAIARPSRAQSRYRATVAPQSCRVSVRGTVEYVTSADQTVLLPLISDPPAQPGYAGEGKQAVTESWSGAAFDYANKVMYVAVPGGHSSWYPNESFAYYVESRYWKKLHGMTSFPPEGVLDSPNPTPGYEPNTTTPITRSVYHDGKPCSRHTYGGTIWLPNQRRVMHMSGSRWLDGSNDGYSGWLDPATGLWAQKTNINQSVGIFSAYDASRSQVIWGSGYIHKTYSYNPALDRHTLICNDGPNIDPEAHAVIDPTGDVIYIWCYWAMVRASLASRPLTWRPVNITGYTGAIFNTDPDKKFLVSFDYDPDRNALVFWSAYDPGAVTIVSLANPSNLVATRQAIGVTPPATHCGVGGIWGRFRRYATNSYVLFADPYYPVYTFTI